MTSTKFFDAFSLVVTRGQLVVTRDHSWSLVVTRGHSCVLLDTTENDVASSMNVFENISAHTRECSVNKLI